MKKIISLVLALTMLAGMLLGAVPATAAGEEVELPFIDVQSGTWYYPSVEYLYDKGIMEGKSATTFAPMASMTRAEFVTMISRLLKADTAGCEQELEDFTDAKTDKWYSESLGWAVREELVTGYNDKTIRPNTPVLRQELAVLIVRFLKYIETELPENPGIEAFADKDDIPKWAAESAETLRVTGLSKGDNKGYFLPAKTATRAEVAALTERLIKSVEAVREANYAALLPADGTEYAYDGEMTAEAVNTWLYNQTVTNNTHTSAEIQNIEDLISAYNGLNDGESVKVDVTVEYPVNGYDIINTKTYKIEISKPEVIDPNDALAPNGTEYTYEGEMTEDALNVWILGQAANEAEHDKAVVKNFAEIKTAYEGLKAGKQTTLDLNVEFEITSSGVKGERTYRITLTNNETDTSDPTPDNIGVAYEDASGLKISNLIRIEDENGIISSCGTGVHGNYETRITRTENGTYAVYLTYENENPPEDHPLWVFGEVEFSIVKITANGSEVLYKDRYPRALGSCAPNILNGEDGKVYVTIIADDKDKYMSSGYTKEGAWLAVYELDTNTDTITRVSKATPDFDTTPSQSHGYGYSQPVLDLEHGKIYAVYNGGECPGYLAWFIYDIETGEWDRTCHTVQTKYRAAYINAYVDGKGGFNLVIQRCAPAGPLGEELGVSFTINDTSYIWDALYIYHISDPTVSKIDKIITIREPEYSTTETNAPQTITHYHNGCTYLDDKGNLHIIYSHRIKTKTTTYHAVYDSDLNEKKNEQITFTRKNNSSSNSYSFAMTQGLDGTYYIFAEDTYGVNASMEVWTSEDGLTFTKLFDKQDLVTKELQTLIGSDEKYTVPSDDLIIANVRNNSINDGIVALMLGLKSNHEFLYFSIELP